VGAGVALHEVICDESGRPCDYRFLGVNPAFEDLIGLAASDIIGRTVLEVLPTTEPVWIERYGRVALGRAPVRFEESSGALGRSYEVRAYAAGNGRFVVTFTDVSEHKQAEAVLRESEALYRSILSASPDDITTHTLVLVGDAVRGSRTPPDGSRSSAALYRPLCQPRSGAQQ
jgi:PAS domain S-box-containing protein